MDMQNLLNKLNGLLAENEAGPVKQCVSCGEKAHVDHTTGMCVDCLTKAEEEQGLSKSPMSRATADTKMKAKKCAFCGGNIVGRGKTTEKGDTICKDCDDYYAFDGPGGEEPGISESPMGRRAPAEPHTCETCGRSMPNWEPGDGAECDECAEGMSPEDSDPDELDEASATKNALYGQMKKTSTPRTFKPEISDEPIDTDQFDFEDENVSCWGCGQDWKENWSAEDLGPGEGYEEYGLDADDKICPDCAEELTGGELNEAAMCEDCGSAPCVCEDPLAEKKLTGAEKRKREELVKSMKGADWEERYPGRGEEVMYATATEKAKKLAETEEVEEAKDCKCEGECKCKDKQLDEMRQLAGLMECGEMWDAPVSQAPAVDLQKSKMTVTTSMDSEAGTKQVTVTAEGDGADELMRVLQMAGINVAPTGNTLVDEVANEPNPQTLDSKSMLIDLSGGLNAPHGQYNPDRARDNSMTMVGEAVDNLAARLKAKFNSQK